MVSFVALHVFLVSLQIGLIGSTPQKQQDNKGNLVEVILNNKTRHTPAHQENSEEHNTAALLLRAGKVFRLKNDDTERTHDHTAGSRDGVRTGECHRADLAVNVRDVGWNDWILAPFSFNVNKCVGACGRSLQNATNHAIIQAAAHALRPSEPGPCCVPTKLAPLPVLYVDHSGKPVLKNFQDMVVKECGCR